MPARIEVESAVIKWAGQRSRVDRESLLRRFPSLPKWESGAVHPTLKQLEKYAKATFTPVGYLLLPAPPNESLPIPDLRAVTDLGNINPSPDLLDTIYLCQQRQQWFHEYASAVRSSPCAFVGCLEPGSDVFESAAAIRADLGWSSDCQVSSHTWTDTFRALMAHAEEAGVLVIVSGVVGSNKRRTLDPEEFRGFALVDDLAPLVFVNGADSTDAQMFTLAHELVHLWAGEEALSDVPALLGPTPDVERWCSQVAAELLVPLAELEILFDRGEEISRVVRRLASLFKVSSFVILRRLHDANLIESDAYRVALEAAVAHTGTVTSQDDGEAHEVLGSGMSPRLARALVESVLEGRASYTGAFRLLGIKRAATFERLAKDYGH